MSILLFCWFETFHIYDSWFVIRIICILNKDSWFKSFSRVIRDSNQFSRFVSITGFMGVEVDEMKQDVLGYVDADHEANKDKL